MSNNFRNRYDTAPLFCGYIDDLYANAKVDIEVSFKNILQYIAHSAPCSICETYEYLVMNITNLCASPKDEVIEGTKIFTDGDFSKAVSGIVHRTNGTIKGTSIRYDASYTKYIMPAYNTTYKFVTKPVAINNKLHFTEDNKKLSEVDRLMAVFYIDLLTNYPATFFNIDRVNISGSIKFIYEPITSINDPDEKEEIINACINIENGCASLEMSFSCTDKKENS